MEPFNRNQEKMQQQISGSISQGQQVPPFNKHPLVMIPTPSSIFSTDVLQPNRSQPSVRGTSSGTSNPSPDMINSPASTNSADPNQMVTPFNRYPLVMMPTASSISTAVLQPNRSQLSVSGISSGTSNPSPTMINQPASTSSANPNQMVTPFNQHPQVMMPTASSIYTAALQPKRSQTILTSTSSGTSNPSPSMIDLPASTSGAHPNQMVPPFNPHHLVMMPTSSSIFTAVLQPTRSQPSVSSTSSGTSNPSPAIINQPALTSSADPNQMVTPFNQHPLVMMPTASSISTASLQPKRSQTILTGTSSRTSNPSPAMIDLPASTSGAHPNQMVPPFNPHPLVMMPIPSSISTAVLQPNRSQTIVTGTSSGTSSPPPAMINLPSSTSMANRNQMVSSPFGSWGVPALTPTTSQPYTHQNISSTPFNPYRDQRFVSTGLGPQIVPNVNSTNLIYPTNPQDPFNKGKQKAVPLASIKRPHDYMASTSNNTTGQQP